MKIWNQQKLAKIITLIKQSDAIEKSILSDHYLDKALAVLEQLPDNKAKKTLTRYRQSILENENFRFKLLKILKNVTIFRGFFESVLYLLMNLLYIMI